MKPKIDFIADRVAEVEMPAKIASWEAENTVHEHEIAVRKLKLAILEIEVATHEYAANILKDRIRGGKSWQTQYLNPKNRFLGTPVEG
jgi:hypothetical protein